MPEAYTIQIEKFTGPLDLLVHLIEKDQLDIYDIPMAQVTEQYIAYLDAMEEYQIEIAVEFLYMAAELLQIKSKMLLPRLPKLEAEETEADPRERLVAMLVEYRLYKKRSEALRALFLSSSLCATRPPAAVGKERCEIVPVEAGCLVSTLLSLLGERNISMEVIPRQEFNVEDKMQQLLTLLTAHAGAIAFSSALTVEGGRSEAIATFLALLELLHRGQISIRQQEAFAPIYIFLKEVAR